MTPTTITTTNMLLGAATTEDVLEENGNTGAVSSEISLPQPTATLSHLLPIPSASHSLTKTTENTAHKTLFSYSSTFGKRLCVFTT